MDRKQVEKMAKKVGLRLAETDGMQKAENDGALWALVDPPYVPRLFFRKLQDAYDHCAIWRGGQEVD